MPTEQIGVIFDKVNRFTEGLVKKITLDTHANLVANPHSTDTGTPVDTGFASSNWVPRVGAPFTEQAGSRPTSRGDINAKAIGDDSKKNFGALDYGPQEDGKVQVAGYRLAMGNCFVSNNVPYIQPLNNGSSKQQPAGFVERAIAKALFEDIRQ